MPFPYVEQARFEREIYVTPEALNVDPGEWDTLITDVLTDESERVEAWTPTTYREIADDVPAVVRDGVIRLARSRLDRIREDGLAREQSPSGAQYQYRPTAEIIAEVQSAILAADLPDPDDEETPYDGVADLL